MDGSNTRLVGVLLVLGLFTLFFVMATSDPVRPEPNDSYGESGANTVTTARSLVLECKRGSAPNVRVMVQPAGAGPKSYPDEMRTVAMSMMGSLRVFRDGDGFVVVAEDGNTYSYVELQPGEVLTCVLGY